MSSAHLKTLSVAGLRPVIGKVDATGKCTTYIVERPPVVFPPISSVRSLSATPGASSPPPANVPMLDEWKTLWKVWDLVTLQMIPQEMLHQKPIDLRHKCLFYIGHIPTYVFLSFWSLDLADSVTQILGHAAIQSHWW